jgi:hypothetical protein
MAHAPAHAPQLYYVNKFDNDDVNKNLKIYADDFFTSKGFIKSDIDTTRALFDANENLCPKYSLRTLMRSAIDGFFTLYLVENGKMICIMTIKIEFDENEETGVIKINDIDIVFYCCAKTPAGDDHAMKSGKSRLLVDIVKSFTENIYLNVTEGSQPYWETKIGATYIPRLGKHKLSGGTKRKRKTKRKTGRR